MKTTLKNVMKLFFALLIPATMLVGCQEDMVNPTADGTPEKDKVVIRPGS